MLRFSFYCSPKLNLENWDESFCLPKYPKLIICNFLAKDCKQERAQQKAK